MKDFVNALNLEIKETRNLLARSRTFIDSAPVGHLTIRKRIKKVTYYWEIDEKRKNTRYNRQVNITEDKEMILKLTNKKMQQEIHRRCDKNLKCLENLQAIYRSIDADVIKETLAPKYQTVWSLRKSHLLEMRMAAPYSKCPYNPKYHTHETDCGELVRSKSEQILANALYAYGIPFHYEEEFNYPIGNIGKVYPDFTIHLPDGQFVIWEHLGLLNNEKYCYDNAKKLNIYQLNGLVLGGNLILTMDDNKGNFSSGIINKIIRTQLLPHFDDIKID